MANLGLVQSAWFPESDFKVISVLRKFQLQCVDVMPTKYTDLQEPTSEEICAPIHFWEKEGFRVTGVQGFLFNKEFQLCTCIHSMDALLPIVQPFLNCANYSKPIDLIFGAPKVRYQRNGHACGEREFLRALSEIGAIFSGTGMRITVENLPLNPTERLYYDELPRLLNDVIEIPNIGLVVDFGNHAVTYNSAYDFQKSLKKLSLESVDHFQWRVSSQDDMNKLVDNFKFILDLVGDRALTFELPLSKPEKIEAFLSIVTEKTAI